MDNNKINVIANLTLSVMADSECCCIILVTGVQFQTS